MDFQFRLPQNWQLAIDTFARREAEEIQCEMCQVGCKGTSTKTIFGNIETQWHGREQIIRKLFKTIVIHCAMWPRPVCVSIDVNNEQELM